MKRPLTTVALLYASGLLLGNNFHLPLPGLFVAAFAGLLVAIFFNRIFLLWPVVILAGWINLQSRTEILSPHDLRTQLGDQPEYVTVRGKLRHTPNFRVFTMEDEDSWRTLAQIEITEILRKEKWSPAFGRVMTSTSGVLDEKFCGGQEIEVTGILQIPRAPLADGLFDYRTYLQRQGIYYQLTVDSTNDWNAAGHFKTRPFPDRFSAWAQKVLQRGLPMEDEPLRLVWAMSLGWKTALTDEVSEPFMRSGTMHIFAISGLHIALIAGILVALLRVMQVPRGGCGLIVIPLIWFYTAATGWQSSAIRSTIMMTIIIGGWSLKRPTDLLNSLAAAAFIILIWEPQQLFQASFQLSFFVVLSIALFAETFRKYRDHLLETKIKRSEPLVPFDLQPFWQRWITLLLRGDPLLPAEARPLWRQRLHGALRYVIPSLGTSLAAFLGSLPLVAYYFHLFNPVSILANLVIVPLSSLALMSNLGSLICGNWFPSATELFNHAGWFFMKLMVLSSHWFASWRLGHFYVPAPSIMTCVIYYFLLCTILTGWLLVPWKRLFTLSLMAVALILCLWNWREESRSAKITILPLSGGEAIFVDCPGRTNDLLVDCGNENPAQLILKPFLRAQGVNSIGNFLLTHGDLQHVGGIETIKRNFSVGKIFTSSAPAKSASYRKIISQLKASPAHWKTLGAGDRFGDWTALHPQNSEAFPAADDNALVLRGEIFGRKILLLSDLGRPRQNALMERNTDLRADIVVAGLPAHGEPVCDALLEKIQPSVIVITDSEFPATQRASRKLRERLANQNARVIYCRDAGAVTLNFKPEGFDLHSCKQSSITFASPSQNPLKQARVQNRQPTSEAVVSSPQAPR